MAERIRQVGSRENFVWRYGFIALEHNGQLYGAFQTKLHYRYNAAEDLVTLSARKLYAWLQEHPHIIPHMAYPAIGLGGMKPHRVWQILEEELKEYMDIAHIYRKRPSA